MSLVITRETRSNSCGRETALDRAVRLVPIEVISFYTAAVTVTRAAAIQVGLALLIAGVLVTPLVLALDARRHRLVASSTQHVVRILSFIAWAFAVANPLAPAAPIEAWMPAMSIVVVPLLGTLLFPPSELR